MAGSGRLLKKKIVLCFVALLLLMVAQGIQGLLLLPTQVTRFEGDEGSFDFNLPWPIRFEGRGGEIKSGISSTGSYSCSFSLLGLVNLKRIQIDVIPRLELIPSGHSIGVKLAAKGVWVVGLDSIPTARGRAEPAKESGFMVGDILLAVNDVELKNLGQAAIVIEEHCISGEKVDCLIMRQGKNMTLTILPAYDVELKRSRLGLLLKDTTAGVGTMTFYDKKTGRFGALGHIITDENGSTPLDMSAGHIVEASIIAVRKGQQGKPGEKQGVFAEESQPLGAIEANTELGIFGRLVRRPTAEARPLPLALKHEATVGKAEMLTVIEGDQVKAFSIEIEKIFYQNQPAAKGMVIRITDQDLLAATGGIIQGMSGSPIIQKGKIVGAVTHVFINEPQRGYGCFAEWMVIESGLLSETETFTPPRMSEALLNLLFLYKTSL